jgi:hypothetical protein
MRAVAQAASLDGFSLQRCIHLVGEIYIFWQLKHDHSPLLPAVHPSTDNQ